MDEDDRSQVAIPRQFFPTCVPTFSLVMPDMGYRASIWGSFRMDPRLLLAGMTKKKMDPRSRLAGMPAGRPIPTNTPTTLSS